MPTGHDYLEPEYVWAGDKTTCEGVTSCENCGNLVNEIAKAQITKVDLPKCDIDGINYIEADFKINLSSIPRRPLPLSQKFCIINLA